MSRVSQTDRHRSGVGPAIVAGAVFTTIVVIVAALILLVILDRYTAIDVQDIPAISVMIPSSGGPNGNPPTLPAPTPHQPTPAPADEACNVDGEPAAMGQRAVVSSDGVNLRAGPGTDCNIVTMLVTGAEVRLVSAPVEDATGTEWVNVGIDSGETGWLSTEYLVPVPEVTPEDTPTPEPRPDLAVAAVDVLPQKPVQGIAYTYNVYATNLGTTHSGEFRLNVIVVEVTSGATYPDGWHSHAGLHPGEQYPVHFVGSAYANCAGPHEVRVEFTVPQGDADPSNNTLVQPFFVQPNSDLPQCS